MIVYHGSSQIIEAPNISFSKNYLDFGKGFYLTTFKKQAEKWAERKASRYRGEPIVNEYELSDDLSSFSVLKFDNENEKWLDFVCSCRNGQQLDKNYDIIIGNVADDDVFKSFKPRLFNPKNCQKILFRFKTQKEAFIVGDLSKKILNENLKENKLNLLKKSMIGSLKYPVIQKKTKFAWSY